MLASRHRTSRLLSSRHRASDSLLRPFARLSVALLASAWIACGPADGPADGEADTAAAGDTAAEPGTAESAASDSAQMLANRLMEWQGGAEAWDRTRYLAFDWIVERGGEEVARRSHAWDRDEARYRVSWEREDGTRLHALFDVTSMKSDTTDPEGEVWVDGDPLTGAARDSALRDAYGAFINDSYWLLMPLKWEDPGVHLAYEGRTELAGDSTFATVHLTFDEGLGVTNDEYWGYVDPESGRMAAWRYHLQGQEQRGSVIWWRDWRTFGPQEIRLALDRRWSEGDARIHFEQVAADTAPPDDAFAPPGG